MIAIGSEDASLSEEYCRIGECFVMVCAVNDDKHSVREIRSKIENLTRIKRANDLPIIFSINKIDLLSDNEMKTEIIEEYRNEIRSIINDFSLLNTSIVESSAKTGENVTQIFEEAARRHRLGTVGTIELLKNVIEQDSVYIQICKTGSK